MRSGRSSWQSCGELGRADRYEREIAAEVAERVNQLKGLDEALRSASGLS